MIRTFIQSVIALALLVIAFLGGIYVKTLFTPKMTVNVPKIAVVNIEEVVAKSPMLAKVRQENERKLQELSEWVDKVNKDIDKEKDPDKHNKLAEQYVKLTQEKEAFIKQEYYSKLQTVDLKITALIDKIAKENGCNIVFSKTSIVSGGTDITKQVLDKLAEF